MKKLLILLFIIPVLCSSQNRFENLFKDADSAFYEQVQKDAVDAVLSTDSLTPTSSRAFYNCIMDCEFDTDRSIVITEHDYLNEYMNAYMMGQLAFYYNKNFDYDILDRKLKKIKSEFKKIDKNTFNRPYKVKRIDEHEVQLIYKKDTVRMYLENTYQFTERLVYLKK